MKRVIPILALLLGGCGVGLVSEESARSFCVENVIKLDPPDELSDFLPVEFFGDEPADTIFDFIVGQLFSLRLSGRTRAQALRAESCSSDAACLTCWSLMVDFAFGPDGAEFVRSHQPNVPADIHPSPPPCQPLTGFEICALQGDCTGFCPN